MHCRPLSGDLIFFNLNPPNPLHPLVALHDDASQLTGAVMRPLIVSSWWFITNPDKVKALCAVWNNRFLGGHIYLPLHSTCAKPQLKQSFQSLNLLYSRPYTVSLHSGLEKPSSAVVFGLHVSQCSSCRWHMGLTNEMRCETTDKKKVNWIPVGN